jgi:hypothetical protein
MHANLDLAVWALTEYSNHVFDSLHLKKNAAGKTAYKAAKHQNTPEVAALFRAALIGVVNRQKRGENGDAYWEDDNDANIQDVLGSEHNSGLTKFCANMAKQTSSAVKHLCMCCGKSDVDLDNLCSVKEGAVPKLRTCPCGTAWYCNTSCQKSHWGEHKKEHKQTM